LWQTAAGCDSLVTIHLTIASVLTEEVTASACETYEWNNEVFTESGTYERSFESVQGCDSIVTLQLTINQRDTVSIAETVCDAYVWGGTTYSTSGEYSQTFENATGCDSVVNLNLTIVATPAAVISGDDVLSIGESTTLTAMGGDSYTWNTGETTSSITVSPTDTTEYYVIAYNENLCADTAYFTINVVSGVVENAVLVARIFPNPANTVINIDAENIQTINVYNNCGQLVKACLNVNADIYQLNVTDLVNGIYLIHLVGTNGNVARAKLIIQH
ncbi:MAG: T9SS type A sorting domain-containing protein, partial [Bacteroidales bacterium]|nr:T9SS type A sorting domain-containing protein [Bacteroidales bacterium]